MLRSRFANGDAFGLNPRPRLLGVQEVPSSNLGGPTKRFQTLTAKTLIPKCVLASTWSPKPSGKDAKPQITPSDIFSLALSTSRKNPTNPTFCF